LVAPEQIEFFRTLWASSARLPRKLVYPNNMDHLEVLQEKIGNLRAEIAQIHELNQQYRLRKSNKTIDQVAHGQRHERLQDIQKELGRLAALGRSVVSISQVREKNRTRLQLIKNSRAS
jgi:hypothetical protein